MSRTAIEPTGRETNRGLFYSRDSGGKHEQTPSEYVLWARIQAERMKVRFNGMPEEIELLMKTREPHSGDIFFDFCVQGNLLSRPALDAMKSQAARDQMVSHIFIPRRDRLARPDDAHEGVDLENEFRFMGITLVFIDTILLPLEIGQRPNLGESLAAFVAYDGSGRFRDELAEKMIFAQRSLAKAGYSTGGRAPFGFRRYLICEHGDDSRLLMDSEIVRQMGYHVVWLPGPDEELDLIRRILEMLVNRPAFQVAGILTAEGIPSPDAGRHRTDNGVRHAVSGIWHQTTIVNIARNPLLRATTSYGRRSMGDCRRVSPDGPRLKKKADLRPDGKPKVVQNPESHRVIAAAHGPSIAPIEQIDQVIAVLDQRAGTQRGKPRSHDPDKNPLGGRIFDANCGSRMYRISRNKTFYYSCGLYQQSHSQKCDHNQIDGMTATRFALASVRQFLSRSDLRERLVAKLRERTAAGADEQSGDELKVKKRRSELNVLDDQIETAMRNLAFTKSPEAVEGLEQIVVELKAMRSRLDSELRELEAKNHQMSPPDDLISRALAKIDLLPQLVDDASNLASIGALFRRIDLQMYLRFQPVLKTKRTLNQMTGGVLTIGAVPAPIEKCSGPTDTRWLKQSMKRQAPGEDAGSKCSTNSSQKVKSSRNVNRDDRTAIELLCSRFWQGCLDDGNTNSACF